jgi:hypothetical protein
VSTKSRALAQIFEIAAVLLFTGWLILLYSQPQWLRNDYIPVWVILFLLFAAVLMFVALTVLFTYRSNQDDQRLISKTRYVITKHRINTLKAAGVPTDVSTYLDTIIGETFPSQEKFLALLTNSLGPERTAEVKAMVLKYTKDYKPVRTPKGETAAPAAKPLEGTDTKPSSS